MLAFLILLLITSLIIFIQVKIWKRAPNVIFPFCTFIFYYWSLAGAWIFVIDQSFNEFGRKIGMTYYVYLEKVYPVKLDDTYTQMILYYGLFIFIFQLTILFVLKKKFIQVELIKPKKAFLLDLRIISLVIFTFIILSFLIVRIPIYKSILTEESIYINVRKGLVPFYSFHQLLNLGACFLAYFTFAVFLKKEEEGQFTIVRSKIGLILFIFAFILTNIWLVFLGNRHEILILGIVSFSYLAFPTLSKRHLKPMILLIVVLFLSFISTDPIRSLAPKILKTFKEASFLQSENTRRSIDQYILLEAEKNYADYLAQQELLGKRNVDSIAENAEKKLFVNLQHNKNVSHVYYGISKYEQLKKALATVVFSNEMFSGQFSMYASLKEDLPISFGHSLKSAIMVFVPKSIIKNRPESSYEYYARLLLLDPAQGFTINHATDWYLNFGVLGLILGGVFWGVILSMLYIGSYRAITDWKKLLYFISLISVAAYFAMVIRGGIDVLKVILFEAVLIPVLLVICCHYAYLLFNSFKNSKVFKK